MKKALNCVNWYCASFDKVTLENGEELFPDCAYFAADTDEAAIDFAMKYAKQGEYYSDCGHVELDLISVCKVDPDNEWEETETIWC